LGSLMLSYITASVRIVILGAPWRGGRRRRNIVHFSHDVHHVNAVAKDVRLPAYRQTSKSNKDVLLCVPFRERTRHSGLIHHRKQKSNRRTRIEAAYRKLIDPFNIIL
jgi:hypothetical protein